MSEQNIAEVEEWRPVKGFEGLYSVSNIGRVRSEKFGRFVTGGKNQDGYMQLCLRKDGRNWNVLAHRAVLEAFIPQPQDWDRCNHKNGVKTFNHISNLEWSNPSHNMCHAYRVLKIRTGGVAKGTPTRKYTLNENIVKIAIRRVMSGESIAGVASDLGVNPGTISHIMNGRNWKHVSREFGILLRRYN